MAAVSSSASVDPYVIPATTDSPKIQVAPHAVFVEEKDRREDNYLPLDPSEIGACFATTTRWNALMQNQSPISLALGHSKKVQTARYRRLAQQLIELRGYVSIKKPLAETPRLKRVSDQPPVYVIENFLTSDECDELKAVGGPGLKRSIVVDGTAGKSSAPTRTSQSCFLNKASVSWLCDKVAKLTKKPPTHQEPPQVCRYYKGQFYKSHFDAFDLNTAPGRECCFTGGNRVGTVLVYLTDAASGGGTYFPKLDLRVLPKKGKALVFFPCTLDGKLDKLALHTGEEADEEKWVSQVWIRQGRYQ